MRQPSQELELSLYTEGWVTPGLRRLPSAAPLVAFTASPSPCPPPPAPGTQQGPGSCPGAPECLTPQPSPHQPAAGDTSSDNVTRSSLPSSPDYKRGVLHCPGPARARPGATAPPHVWKATVLLHWGCKSLQTGGFNKRDSSSHSSSLEARSARSRGWQTGFLWGLQPGLGDLGDSHCLFLCSSLFWAVCPNFLQ